MLASSLRKQPSDPVETQRDGADLTSPNEWSLQTTVSHLHFIGGEKGGVGKSVVARLLAQHRIDSSRPLAIVDGDLSHGAMMRHYGEYSQLVDLSAPDSADQILDRALASERDVIVDLPAQSARALQSWIFGANVLELARELGIAVTFWHVSDGGFASLSQVAQALELYGDRVQHVVVRNHGRSKDFAQFESSGVQARLESLAGKVLDLPELDSSAMYKIDRWGLSFWAAVHHTGGDFALRPLERERVKLWLARCHAALSLLTNEQSSS